MTWRRLDTRFALVGFGEPPTSRAIEVALGDVGGQIIREGGETTLLVPMAALPEVLACHPGARTELDFLAYRFESPMDWDVVGFLALVTRRLAESGVPVCALCAFSRDYVLVAEKYGHRTSLALAELFPEADSFD